MRVEGFALALRPRTMAEAADLGAALVREWRRSVWGCHAPLVAFVFVLGIATIEIAPWLPTVLIFWLKPFIDRALLFVLSRAAFGEATDFGTLWRAQRSVLWRGWLGSLTWRRLSPWRSYTQPITQLEGQRGKALRARHAQILRGRRGAAFGMHQVFAVAEAALVFAALSLALWFAPEGTRQSMFRWASEAGQVYELVVAATYTLVVLVLEPFYVAAGFAMYLNRRVELEAWDVEQEFRRAFAA